MSMTLMILASVPPVFQWWIFSGCLRSDAVSDTSDPGVRTTSAFSIDRVPDLTNNSLSVDDR